MVGKDSSSQPIGHPKSKNIEIVISELVAQQANPLQSNKYKVVSLSKYEGKMKVVESGKVSASTRACTKPLKWEGFILKSTFVPHPNTQIIVYKGFLFGM